MNIYHVCTYDTKKVPICPPLPAKSTICSYAPGCVYIVKQRMSYTYASKVKLPAVFQKRNLNFAFAFDLT